MTQPPAAPSASAQSFGRQTPITDICLLVEDIDRSVAFYMDRMGFALRRKHPHFADFVGLGVTLALWRVDHFRDIAALPPGTPAGGRALVAVQLGGYAELDDCYRSLSASGIDFTAPPCDLPWNARGIYFADPDGTFWEIYAYRDGLSVD